MEKGFRCLVSWPSLTAHLKATDCPGVWNKNPTTAVFSELLIQACDPAGGGCQKEPREEVQGSDAAVYQLFSMTAPGIIADGHCSHTHSVYEAKAVRKSKDKTQGGVYGCLQFLAYVSHWVCLSHLWRWFVPFYWFWCYQVLCSLCRIKQTSPVGPCKVYKQVQPPALSHLGPVALSNHNFIIKVVIKSVSLAPSVRALERKMWIKLLFNYWVKDEMFCQKSNPGSTERAENLWELLSLQSTFLRHFCLCSSCGARVCPCFALSLNSFCALMSFRLGLTQRAELSLSESW